MIIAIDGPAASGKGTIARRLATHYGFRHLDTGLIYRAVAKALIDAGIARDDSADARRAAIEAATTLDPTEIDERALKSNTVGEAASHISVIPEVRAAVFRFQQAFAAVPPGAVLDGRDIGTVIAPNAEVKIFVTAAAEERARRRALEMRSMGQMVNDAEILIDIRLRDDRDTTRAVAPLKPAPDAHLLDTTHLDIDAAVRAAIDIVEAVRAGRGGG
jgi:cytidylate kinase